MIFFASMGRRSPALRRVAGVLGSVICVCLIFSCTPAPQDTLQENTAAPLDIQPTHTILLPTSTAQPTITPSLPPIPTEKVALPELAGSWYPADAVQLAAEVDGYLEAVRPIDGEPLVLIVPQTQYAFSGKISASAYKQLLNGHYDTAIILATAMYPPHPAPIAVWDEGVFETPLGGVEVDRALARSIIAADALLKDDDKVFDGEPGIEIQLPFLQRVCPNCRIVPILIDDDNDEAIQVLAQVLSQAMRRGSTVLIAGSNLSQYPNQHDGMPLDDEIMKAIETGSEDAFSEVIDKCLAKNIPNVTTCAYGETSIRTAIHTANLLGAETVSLLNYGNSGNAPNGDPSRVTGYGAVMLWHYEPPVIRDEHKTALLSLARKVLSSRIGNGMESLDIPEDAVLQRRSGVFVILKLDERVWGSMGHMRADLPLSVVVQEMALASMTSNPRLASLTEADLKRLKIEISISSPPRRIKTIEDITLGMHGLLIQERNHQGVLLPQVQMENQWGRPRFLDHLCTVAGLSMDCWKKNIAIYSFTTITFGE